MKTFHKTLLAASIAAAGTTGAYAADAVETLPAVVVTSTRTGSSSFDAPASVDVVSGDKLRDGKMQINLSEGLGGVPGLQIKDRQNYAQDLQLSVRGFGARSSFGVRGLRLYVDGIPATMPDGQGQTSNIDIASTDRVEVLRGPFSSLYGNSSGGVIQVFTEDGAGRPTVSASMSAGGSGTYRYGLKASGSTGTGIGAIDYTLSGTRFTTEGYRDHSAAQKNLANAKLGWRPDEDSKFTLILNSVDLKAQDPLGLTRQQYETSPRSAALAEQYNTRKTVQQTQGGLVYERRIDSNNELRAMVYYGQRSNTQFQSIPASAQVAASSAGAVIDLDRNYGGTDLRWTHKTELAGKPFTLIGGLAYDNLSEKRKGYENFVTTGGVTQLGQLGRLRRDEDNQVWNLDQYVQGQWQFADRWTLDAGVRHSTVRFASTDNYIVTGNGDDSGKAKYNKTLPTAALRFQATPTINLYASAGRGFETPTFNEISYRSGGLSGLNFALQPSSSDSLEVGAKAQVAGGLLTTALFHTKTDDEIVTDTSSGGRSTYRNAGKTVRRGFEMGWTGRAAQNWQTQLAYSFLDATYRDCGSATCTPSLAGKQMPGIARQALFGSVGWVPTQGFRASLEGRYLSKVYVDDANSDAAAGNFVAAASVGYVMTLNRWTLAAFARLDNMFDRRYAGSVIVNESNGRYFETAPGRNASAGVTVSYSY